MLIISPHFPPVNAADMQRIRMSLPYYSTHGWKVEILTVSPDYIDGFTDSLLNITVPDTVIVHRVKALPLKLTRKFGLGSLSLRCYFSFKRRGSEILKTNRFDLVFFSTTMFHVCALGRYWKKRFGVPFIIDFQDPWRNDFYLDKPKHLLPPKFKFAYLLNKWMEAYTMPYADGIMAVSQGYIRALHERYSQLSRVPSKVIPFGCSTNDFEVAKRINATSLIEFNSQKINVVYIGAVTKFFLPLIEAFFEAFIQAVEEKYEYQFWFIGTSYAPGSTVRLVEDLATAKGLQDIVLEHPGRIPYFETILMMQRADVLFVPGSRDVDYNASKIYNCVIAKRPIFSIFNEQSEVVRIIEKTDSGVVVAINGNETQEELIELILKQMDAFKQMHTSAPHPDKATIYPYTAEARTADQVELFDLVVKNKISGKAI